LKRNKQKAQLDPATLQFNAGLEALRQHPVFAPLLWRAYIVRNEGTRYPQAGYALVTQTGHIYCHPKVRLDAEVWTHVIAHCLLHLAMGHFVKKENHLLWNIACDAVVEHFLSSLKIGRPPDTAPEIPPVNDEERFYKRLLEGGVRLEELKGLGTAGDKQEDMVFVEEKIPHWGRAVKPEDWAHAFAAGLSQGVKSAVDVAGGLTDHLVSDPRENQKKTTAEKAREWFISSYPLLGAIASSFKLVENIDVCHRMDIQTAAVSAALKEIYINPLAGLSDAECRFVMALEFLHAALRHDARKEWRDAYLWNVACDYVINLWLTEMGVGDRPPGCLYDESLKGYSAESVYDRIATDMRRYRKLATLRGLNAKDGFGDILPGKGNWWEHGDGMDLDDFYRRALADGLSYHEEQGRGYLPAGLVEEIRALNQPPIPWDVELARWFDDYFTPLEKRRSYARLSRRQSSTPDIPRPAWVQNLSALDGRTFGVVLDTSGSMDRALLGAALGAIASYSVERDVPAVRVIFCDAESYDQGYMRPEDIAGNVKVKGRGGTVLQPGIDRLIKADDFPKDAPILIITDAWCESRLILYGRKHAFLIPRGASLPFVPKGKVFRMAL
jgi:predicted metal-dependent peptidase